MNQDRAERIKATEKPQIIEDPLLSGFALRIQPTGRKSWVLRYVNRTTGKRTTKTLGKLPVDTYGIALEWAKAILRGEDPFAKPETDDKPDSPALTFQGYLDDYYERYIRQHHSRPDETLSYLKATNLGNKVLADITLADAEAYRLDRKAAGKAATTINRETATLKAALQRAVDWNLLETNPLAKLKPLKTDKRAVVRYLSEDEEVRFLDALTNRDERKRVAKSTRIRPHAAAGNLCRQLDPDDRGVDQYRAAPW